AGFLRPRLTGMTLAPRVRAAWAAAPPAGWDVGGGGGRRRRSRGDRPHPGRPPSAAPRGSPTPRRIFHTGKKGDVPVHGPRVTKVEGSGARAAPRIRGAWLERESFRQARRTFLCANDARGVYLRRRPLTPLGASSGAARKGSPVGTLFVTTRARRE